MDKNTISAMVLAAGESTRMGRLKQLLPWDGTTLLDWQVREARKGGVDDIVVVLGHAMETIRDSLIASGTDTRMVVNEAYQEGRASSFRRGAETIDDEVAAFVIFSVDQPRPAWVTHRLIAHWRRTHASIVMATYQGQRGHPVLLAGHLLPELRKVTDKELGLRAVVQRHADEVETVEMGTLAIHVNLNTPEAYESAKTAFDRGEWQEPAD
jgi:molybdenum cofactor cytidylyltransferase